MTEPASASASASAPVSVAAPHRVVGFRGLSTVGADQAQSPWQSRSRSQAGRPMLPVPVVLRLHRTIGNRAVSGLLTASLDSPSTSAADAEAPQPASRALRGASGWFGRVTSAFRRLR
jgi:hypothetical protein